MGDGWTTELMGVAGPRSESQGSRRCAGIDLSPVLTPSALNSPSHPLALNSNYLASYLLASIYQAKSNRKAVGLASKTSMVPASSLTSCGKRANLSMARGPVLLLCKRGLVILPRPLCHRLPERMQSLSKLIGLFL